MPYFVKVEDPTAFCLVIHQIKRPCVAFPCRDSWMCAPNQEDFEPLGQSFYRNLVQI